MVKFRYKLDHERFSGSVRVWCAYKGWEEATAGSMRTQSWNSLFQRFLSKINILQTNIHVKVRLVLTILSVSKLAATGSRKVRKRPGSCESRKMNPESSVRQRYRLVLQWTTAATLHTAVWVNTHTHVWLTCHVKDSPVTVGATVRFRLRQVVSMHSVLLQCNQSAQCSFNLWSTDKH